MMNTMRKSISLLLTLLLTFSLVSVATAEGNPVLEGVYDLEKNDFGMETFYHFNADGTYYASFFMGAVTDAGTYEIKDEELTYMVSAGADGTAGTEDDEMATATQIVELVSYVNPTPVKVAYVDGKLVDISLAGMANHRTMALTEGKAYDASTETPIKVVNLYADNLEGNTLTLYHDKSFVDYTGEMGIYGTWEKNEDGSYTLTDEDDEDNVFTLTWNEDGTASYSLGDGETKDLTTSIGPVAFNVFKAENVQVANADTTMGANLTLNCYDDGTCVLLVNITAIGMELEADKGTYTVADVFNYTFNFETAGEIVGQPDWASATASGIGVNVPYAATVQAMGSDLVIDAQLAGTASIAQ